MNSFDSVQCDEFEPTEADWLDYAAWLDGRDIEDANRELQEIAAGAVEFI